MSERNDKESWRKTDRLATLRSIGRANLRVEAAPNVTRLCALVESTVRLTERASACRDATDANLPSRELQTVTANRSQTGGLD